MCVSVLAICSPLCYATGAAAVAMLLRCSAAVLCPYDSMCVCCWCCVLGVRANVCACEFTGSGFLATNKSIQYNGFFFVCVVLSSCNLRRTRELAHKPPHHTHAHRHQHTTAAAAAVVAVVVVVVRIKHIYTYKRTRDDDDVAGSQANARTRVCSVDGDDEHTVMMMGTGMGGGCAVCVRHAVLCAVC